MPLTNGAQDAAAVNSFGRPYSLWMVLDNVPGIGTADALEILAVTRDDVSGVTPPPPSGGPGGAFDGAVRSGRSRVVRARR